MKKAFILLFLLSLIEPITIVAKKKSFGDGLYWELSDVGTLTISGFGNMPDFQKKGNTSPWRMKKDKIRHIVIEKGVSSIGNYAFYVKDFEVFLESVIIPESIISIGEGAFANNICLESVEIPRSVTKIGMGAFNHTGIRSIVIPNSVLSIGEKAFALCKELVSVQLSQSLKQLSDAMFADCPNLNSISLPNSVTSIGEFAFMGCKSLTSIDLPNSVTSIGESAFSGCKSLTSIDLPNSVKTIGMACFVDCSNMATVAIPNSVMDIGPCAFGYDSFKGKILALPQFVIDAEDPESLGFSKSSVMTYKKGIHNKDGRLILSIENGDNASLITHDNKKYYLVEKKHKKGIMDANGEWRIPLKNYNEFNYIGHGYVKMKDGYYGIATLDGVEIISTSRGYLSISDYDSTKESFVFSKKGYSGTCDAQGREISKEKLPPTEYDIKAGGGYSSVVVIMNGSAKYYKVSKNGRYGLTNAEGEEIVPPELDALEECGKGFLRFKVGDYWGVMNYMGKVTIPTERGYTKIGNYVSLTKRFPYTMAGYKGECDATGRQISKIKVETPRQSTSVASSNSSSGSSSSPGSSSKSNSGNKTTTVVVQHHHDPVPVQQWQACFACGGMGTMGCDFCGGSGTRYVGDNLRRCSRCNGRGIIPCNICYGNKGQYVTVYK